MGWLFILFCFLGEALSFQSFEDGSGDGDVPGIEQRDTEHLDFLDKIKELLQNSTKGISDKDFYKSAWEIQVSAEAYLETHGGKVPDEESKAIIQAIADTLDNNGKFIDFFGDLLQASGNTMSNGLHLLQSLAQKFEELEAAQQPSRTVVGAIAFTAGALKKVIQETDAVIQYSQAKKVRRSQQTRSEIKKRFLNFSFTWVS